jgi:hypothetical protein
MQNIQSGFPTRSFIPKISFRVDVKRISDSIELFGRENLPQLRFAPDVKLPLLASRLHCKP